MTPARSSASAARAVGAERRAGRGGPARHARGEARGIKGGDREAIDERDGSVVVLGGDVLTKVDGHDVRSMDDVHAALANRRPGRRSRWSSSATARPSTRTVRLGERPGASRRASRPAAVLRCPRDPRQDLRHHPPRGRRAGGRARRLGDRLHPLAALAARAATPAVAAGIVARAAAPRRASSACSSTRRSTRSSPGRRGDRPHARAAARRRGPGVLRRGRAPHRRAR